MDLISTLRIPTVALPLLPLLPRYITEDFWATNTGTNGTPPTPRPIRGNVPGQTSVPASTFSNGAALAFDRDCYGSQAQAGLCYPTTSSQEAADVFNNAADLIRNAFGWAKELAGVDAALGVEFPLQLPPALQAANVTLREAYEGMFGRIVAANIPISTFWLWTSENVEDHSTGKGLPQNNPLWDKLLHEIHIAQAALDAVNGSFNLGTNGWCLGPGDNASYFDKTVPDASFKVGAINGALGWLPPDPAFAEMDGSRSWAIPWLEDDLALAGAELWVNRTITHANQAHSYVEEVDLVVVDRLLNCDWRVVCTEIRQHAARFGPEPR